MQPTRFDLERAANELVERAARSRAAGRLDEALADADRAVAAVEAIASASPTDATAAWVLAGQLYNRAGIHSSLGDLATGVADARRSFEAYARLAAVAPPCIPQRADAQARLARLLALTAVVDQSAADTSDARTHAAMAVRTYQDIAAVDAAHRPGLARVQHLNGEVLRILDGESSPGSLAAYEAAVNTYRALADELSEEDLRYCAEAALRLAYGHAHADNLDQARAAAQEAVTRFDALLQMDAVVHHDFARALFLLGSTRQLLAEPDWEQDLVDAAYVISVLPEPLPPDLAAIRDQLDPA